MENQSLYSDSGLQHFTDRFNKLHTGSVKQWGKMDATQMVEHCRKVLESSMGELDIKTPLIAKLLGPMLKKKFLKEGKFNRNSPTGPIFKQFSNNNLEQERVLFLTTLNRFSDAGKEGRLADRHPFFGKVTKEEWDQLQKMHLNHHLEQFSS